MKKLLLAFIICLTLVSTATGYETNVHEKITLNAAGQSNTENILSTNLGIHPTDKYSNGKNSKLVKEWLELGSNWEDENISMRWLNHFFDPTTRRGLNSPCIATICESSLQWAKDASGNVWSWKWTRDSYYKALADSNLRNRSAYFSYVFRGLGQVIHLMQDKAVPAHVRNDPHNLPGLNYDMYEMYAKQPKVVRVLNYGGYPSVDLASFDSFNKFWINGGKGLAEFTNRSFLSRDTNIDDAKYILPVPIGEWIVKETFIDPWMGSMQFEVKYLQGYATDNYRPALSKQIDRLSAYSYLDFEMQKYGYTQRVYSLNDRIHQEYAEFLIPRAVGYSAGLLDYFFRGDIKLTFQSATSPGYVIANDSQEDMSGRFEIYYDNLQEERVRLWSGNPTINASQKSAVINLPIVSDAKEPGKYILVFRGKMGNEEDAVAGYVTSRSIEIAPPEQQVYAMVDAATGLGFDSIRVKLRNRSTSEAMQNGTLKAIVKYKQNTQGSFQYTASNPEVVPSLDSAQATEYSFTFPNPIPINATDVYLYISFTGTIGTEANAVAVGEKDISEPTPVDLFNNMDRICINSQWYTAGSPAAISIVDANKNGIANEWDVYSHDVRDIYIRFSSDDAPLDASPAEYYNYRVSKIVPGSHVRVLYILADYKFSYGIYNKWLPAAGSYDPWTHVDESFLLAGNAVKEQTEITSDPAICGSRSSCPKTYTPTYYAYRGTSMWWGAGLIYVNIPYPQTAVCP